MAPEPVIRHLTYIFLQQIQILSHYEIRGHLRRIIADRHESHFIMSPGDRLHPQIQYAHPQFVGQTRTSEHHFGFLVQEYAGIMRRRIGILVRRIYVNQLPVPVFYGVAKYPVGFYLSVESSLHLDGMRSVSFENLVLLGFLFY